MKSELLYILIVLFSVGSWIDINGIWVELPVLVNELPEGWFLPSYITIVIQLANIGPLLYSLVRANVSRLTLHKWIDPIVSFLVLLLGTACCALLISFWDVTWWLFGTERSAAFLSLLFVIGLTDCTSSVAFLSYLSRFPPRYVTAYYVGAGASGLVPSVLALIQGASRVTCPSQQNTTDNGTTSHDSMPTVSYLFSVEAFFATLTGFLIIATIAFVMAHFKMGRRAELQLESTHYADRSESVVSDKEEIPTPNSTLLIDQSKCKFKLQSQYLLLTLTISCSFLMNGFMPSLQTFSVLPYGQEAYYITVCLYALTQPIASFASFFLPVHRVRYCVALNVVAWLSAVLLVTFALISPPPLYKTVGGSVLVCSMWVVMTACVSYSRPNLALMLNHKMSHSGLFWCGILTQCGACAGAMLSFLLVSVLQVFKQTSAC